MKPNLCLLPLLLVASATLASGDDELQSLRAENARLKAQIEHLQHQQAANRCAAASSVSTPSANTALATGVAAPAPTAAMVGAPATNSPSTAPAAPAAPVAPVAPTLPQPPPGYLLIKAPEPNSNTGCRDGFFDFHSVDAPWKHEDNWESLQKGMSPTEVEHWLGNSHYEINRDGRTLWQYGKCGSNVQGTVVFEKGEVLFWQAPDF